MAFSWLLFVISISAAQTSLQNQIKYTKLPFPLKPYIVPLKANRPKDTVLMRKTRNLLGQHGCAMQAIPQLTSPVSESIPLSAQPPRHNFVTERAI
jgi:hypothetical protein